MTTPSKPPARPLEAVSGGIQEGLEASAAPPLSPDAGFPPERARRACEKRQAECPHEWALSTQRNGLLLWRFHQDDCPRCLKMWMNYWRGRAKGAEGVKTIVRRCRCPEPCGVHSGNATPKEAPSSPDSPSQGERKQQPKDQERAPSARSPLRVLVCGGRDYADRAAVCRTLDEIAAVHGPIAWLIEGGAAGADSHARWWALVNKVPALTYRAEWDRYGKRAGALRNQEMLDSGMPNLVVAFPGGRGTADMVRRARKAALPVVEPGNAAQRPPDSALPASSSSLTGEVREAEGAARGSPEEPT